MIIEIDDGIDGKERRKLITILSTDYALKNTKSKSKAAIFLGITERALRDRIKRYKELSEYLEELPLHLKNKSLWYIREYYSRNERFLSISIKNRIVRYLSKREGDEFRSLDL